MSNGNDCRGQEPDGWNQVIDFTANKTIRPNLKGDLVGEVAFIQNTLITPKRTEEAKPLLVTDRGTLLAFFPAKSAGISYRLTVKQSDGSKYQTALLPPWQGPPNDSGNTDGRPEVVFSKRAWYGV
ncbi:MAG: hypothetical protein ACPHL6_07290, partial [Rubripirellula sp.]